MPLTTSELKSHEGAQAGLDRLQQDFRKAVPSIAFEYVTVTFAGTANLDTIVTTNLRPANPEDILYKVVDWQYFAAPASTPLVYKDTSSTRKPWGQGYIVLRCNVASVIAVLELTIKRT